MLLCPKPFMPGIVTSSPLPEQCYPAVQYSLAALDCLAGTGLPHSPGVALLAQGGFDVAFRWLGQLTPADGLELSVWNSKGLQKRLLLAIVLAAAVLYRLLSAWLGLAGRSQKGVFLSNHENLKVQ
jgi:hypothetical protein